MKKMLLILSIVLIGFVSIDIFSAKSKVNLSDNPYGKDDLHPKTIEQLKNEHYQNIILPNKLDSKIQNNQSVTVYFYSPVCPHCTRITPIIVPMAREMDIDLVLFNLLEFNKGWENYNITKTPTLIHYNQGRELNRIEGAHRKKDFKSWFSNHVN